jgi:8-oxo-dGTP pyrophosphatase MutT (NUDIX family)
MKETHPNQFLAQGGAQHTQHAALCWRMHRGEVEVLLITSRDTGRWVIPKGWPMDGKTPAETAAQEAWEEAGVTGTVADTALGAYAYDKLRMPLEPVPCDVSVFPLRVDRVADKFPERKERRRKWFEAAKAARKVAEPQLRALLAAIGDDPALVHVVADPKAAPDTA